MADEQYEVFPEKDGTWGWRLRGEDGKIVNKGSGGYASNSAAFEAACEARGDVVTELFYDGGVPAGNSTVRGGPQRVVLLRADGSVHGELSHELGEGGAAQHISIGPASEATEAVSV